MRRFLRRVQSPTLLAVAALVIAVSAGAPAITASAEDAVSAARQLITGKDVKRGAVSSRHVKDRTLRVRDLAPAAVRSLAEAPGGNAFADTFGQTNIPASGAATVFTQSYPAGSYLFIVTLRAVSVSNQNALFDCSLAAAGGRRRLAEEDVTLRSGDTVILTLLAWTTLEAADILILSCLDDAGVGYQVEDGQVVAMQVAAINPD
jgi:hypothetical protein